MRARILQFIVLTAFFNASPALGGPGDVDPSFAYPRPQVLEPDSTNAIPLANGFLVVKSRQFDRPGTDSTLEVTRIDEDGRVVPTFGSGGAVTLRMPGAVNVATAVKGMPDGSMLLAGFQRASGAVPDSVAAVVRLDAAGRLDPSFGVGGVATFDVVGQVDRVGAIDTLADGRILAGVWSRTQADPYGDCSIDRVSLVRLNPNGTGAEVIYFRERNQYTDSGCRNVMSLQVLPDQSFYFGSRVETVVFDSPQTGAWRAVRPYGCCYGPFAVNEAVGLVWSSAFLGGPTLDFQRQPAYLYDDDYGAGNRLLTETLTGMGFPVPRTASLLVPAGDPADPAAWYLGFSTDGGVAGVAKLRSYESLDTGWAGGTGVVRIDGTGSKNDYLSEGLANDVRLISVRPGGETLVVVTADGVIERRFAKSGPAHGRIRFVAAGSVDVSEGAGSVQVAVQRLGGTEGAVGVDYDVAPIVDCQVLDPQSDGSCARPGEDFVAASGRLDWADGDGADRIITIPIVNDSTHEPYESFRIELRAPTGGASLGTSAVLQVGIVDDDPASPSDAGGGSSNSGGSGGGGGGATNPATMFMLVLMFVAAAWRRTAWKSKRPKRAAAVLAMACALLAGGCAPRLQDATGSPGEMPHYAPAATAPATTATAADDAIICRTSLETGSRVRKNKVCMTKSEWAAHTEAARRYTQSIERSRSTQVGGDSLTPSTPGG